MFDYTQGMNMAEAVVSLANAVFWSAVIRAIFNK